MVAVPAVTSGVAPLVMYALIWGFSFIRGSTTFELLYFTHWLYIAWFALLLTMLSCVFRRG